jgi:hypothetical protein
MAMSGIVRVACWRARVVRSGSLTIASGAALTSAAAPFGKTFVPHVKTPWDDDEVLPFDESGEA